MSIEREEYEKNWDHCQRCGTRKPSKKLDEVKAATGTTKVCRHGTDAEFCDRIVQARGEGKAGAA